MEDQRNIFGLKSLMLYKCLPFSSLNKKGTGLVVVKKTWKRTKTIKKNPFLWTHRNTQSLSKDQNESNKKWLLCLGWHRLLWLFYKRCVASSHNLVHEVKRKKKERKYLCIGERPKQTPAKEQHFKSLRHQFINSLSLQRTATKVHTDFYHGTHFKLITK